MIQSLALLCPFVMKYRTWHKFILSKRLFYQHLLHLLPLGSMLTHTYLHKALRKNKVAICITMLIAMFTWNLMSDLVTCKQRKEYGHTWHQMSLLKLDAIESHKTQTPWFTRGLRRKSRGMLYSVKIWGSGLQYGTDSNISMVAGLSQEGDNAKKS